jgi:hypothetical protein
MAYQFESLHEVPVVWRTYKGARLTLSQVQSIIDESDKETGSNAGLASARVNFEKTHHIENNIWVDGGSE